MSRLAAAALVVLGMPTAAWAQDSVRLRYAPEFGAIVHRVFQSHTRMSTTTPSGGTEGVSTRETVDLGGMEQIAVKGPDGEPIAHLAFDSLRTRIRDHAGPWREFVWGGLDSMWVQVWLDPWLQVERINAGSASPTRGLLVHLLTGLPNLVLPDRWLHAGEGWTALHAVPLTGVVTRGWGDPTPDTLVARTAFHVDSIVGRGADTLAYIGLSGAFVPRSAAGTGALSADGALAGSLIWSQGWSTFVSGAVRLRVNVRAPPDGTSGPGAFITVETTTRHQVRSGT